MGRIKSDGQWDEVIPRSSIPGYFRSKYGVTNLYCVDLPDVHRVFYTIRGRDVVMLDLVDHRQYDRMMHGYTPPSLARDPRDGRHRGRAIG